MIIRREALRAVLPATTADDTRYFLNAIQVSPDGSVRATNGHIALVAQESTRFPDEDFPLVAGADFQAELTKPILIPCDVAKRLADGTDKRAKSRIPVLAGIRIGVDGSAQVLAASTDLKMPTVARIDDDGHTTFPALDRVIPASDKSGTVTVALAINVLEDLIKSAKALGALTSGRTLQTITFKIPTKLTECVDTIRVEMTGSEVSVYGAAMPCRV